MDPGEGCILERGVSWRGVDPGDRWIQTRGVDPGEGN